MLLTPNPTFSLLLKEYNLPEDFSFSVDLPQEVQEMLADKISVSELGVSLKSFGKLYKATEEWENQSLIEDSENHFHVDWHIDPPNNKNAFMLGVKTLVLLAEKFQKEKKGGIRFWYSFQTSELSRLWSQHINQEQNDEEYFISDRLSFFKIRAGEEVIPAKLFESNFWAILVIDI